MLKKAFCWNSGEFHISLFCSKHRRSPESKTETKRAILPKNKAFFFMASNVPACDRGLNKNSLSNCDDLVEP